MKFNTRFIFLTLIGSILIVGCNSAPKKRTDKRILAPVVENRPSQAEIEARRKAEELEKSRKLKLRLKRDVAQQIKDAAQKFSIADLFDYKPAIVESKQEYLQRRAPFKGKSFLVVFKQLQIAEKEGAIYFSTNLAKPNVESLFKDIIKAQTNPNLLYLQLWHDKRQSFHSEFGAVGHLDMNNLKQFDKGIKIKSINNQLVIGIPKESIPKRSDKLSFVIGFEVIDADNPKQFVEVKTLNRARVAGVTFPFGALINSEKEIIYAFSQKQNNGK